MKGREFDVVQLPIKELDVSPNLFVVKEPLGERICVYNSLADKQAERIKFYFVPQELTPKQASELETFRALKALAEMSPYFETTDSTKIPKEIMKRAQGALGCLGGKGVDERYINLASVGILPPLPEFLVPDEKS